MEEMDNDRMGILVAPQVFSQGRTMAVVDRTDPLLPIAKARRGYFAIGIFHTKTPQNIGTLWRSAQNFGAAFIFTIGRRYDKQSSDTCSTPRHVPLFHYDDFDHFKKSRPFDCPLIGVEQADNSSDLIGFCHPEKAVYLLGAEDHGLSRTVLQGCQRIIHISSPMCLNVAVAGSIVMYDRASKS